MKSLILSLLVFATASAAAQPGERAERREELIRALHEIHRDEHLGVNAGEVVEYAALGAQALTLAATGTLAILARHPSIKVDPAEAAVLRRYLDYAVKYAPAAFVGSASLAIVAGILANVAHSNEIMNPIDVRTEEGFAQFLELPLWRQIQIAESDREFERHLIDYANALREVREDFKPRRN